MLRYATILFFSLLSFASFGQGSIAGTITDVKTKEAIIGANVILAGTSKGASTDIEGKFVITNVPAGTYTLNISYMAYKTHVVADLIVEDAKRVTLDIPMQEEASELGEVVVTSGRAYDTDFELLRTIKEMKLIVVGVTSEQIGKTLDRDAAQVLRRVPGIIVKDDQFVQIRGLAERYSPVMLHNAYAPSVETDVRSFSFAAVPSSQLDRVLVFKSPSPDIPGDFAGGVVKIFTKSIPDENGFVVDYSTQFRAGTTFQDFYHQQRNPGHFTGINTGYYDLPSSFPANAGQASASDAVNAGRSLKNLWVRQKSTAIPDQRLTLTYNRKFNIGKVEVGNITALNYSNTYGSFNVARSDNTVQGNKIDQNYGYADKQYNQQIRTGLLFNWAFKLSPAHQIELKNLYNSSSNDQFVDRTGTGQSEGQKNGSVDKVYRGIYSGQLLGTHELFNKRTAVDWVVGYNNSRRDQPDYKRYQSNLDGSTGTATLQISNTVTPNALGRFFSKLNEHAVSGGVNVKQSFSITDNPLKSPELKAGAFFENKSRTFNARNIGYVWASGNPDYTLAQKPVGEIFAPENINTTTGITIGEISDPRNNYTASNNLIAYYLKTSIPFGKFTLDGGARMENNLQQLHGFDEDGKPVDPHHQVNRLLPSANLSYNFSDKMLLRAAYGQTLNRPEFRELAPFAFFDFNYNFVFHGDPGLETTKIQNVDLRWELYPSKTEMITVGGFYKKLNNPIEAFISYSNSGGGTKDVTYGNSDYATAVGAEIEVKKSLAGLTGSGFLNNLNIMANAILIKSTVHVPANLVGRLMSRPLQGQAPYVFNAAVFYDNAANGWQVNLLYNVVGRNIVFVGTDQYPDVYTMPRNVIDLIVSKQISPRVKLKGGISDLLSQPVQWLQDGNQDGKFDRKNDITVQKFTPGQVFSVGLSVKL